MKKELDEALVRDFPNLYADRNAPMNQTCMCWGFPGNGWEPLIRRLSEKLEAIINSLPPPEQGKFKASQVKEKFGTLRFYMTYETEEMSKAIGEAERESAVTCEICGQPGDSKGSKGWISTLCKECRKSNKRKWEE